MLVFHAHCSKCSINKIKKLLLINIKIAFVNYNRRLLIEYTALKVHNLKNVSLLEVDRGDFKILER